MEEKKICVDCRITTSGIGNYTINNLLHVEKNFGYKISLLIKKNLSDFSKNVKQIKFPARIYSLREQILFIRSIPKSDLFWSPHYNIPILPIRAKKRIVTIHDVYHLRFIDDLSIAKKIYAKVILNLAVRLSDHIITVSNFSKNEIVKLTGCMPDKVKVIYNGVRQVAAYKPFTEVKAKYGLYDKYILFVGNVKPHKNLIRGLKAFAGLPKHLFETFNVVIVGQKDGLLTGDPDLFKWLEMNKDLENKIVFTGFVDDGELDSIYRHASLFVFPSFYEGFGLPPLEAMLNHCPVIASNSSSIPEICGDAVHYFDPLDDRSIRSAMLDVLSNENLVRNLIQFGLERIKLFTWEKAGLEHEVLFNSVLNGKI